MIKNLQSSFKNLLEKVPNRYRNRYVFMFTAFFMYMLIFDKHDFITHFRLYHTELTLKRDKESYRTKIIEAREMRKKLESDRERFAREKYFVHKPGEDVFVIIRN